MAARGASGPLDRDATVDIVAPFRAADAVESSAGDSIGRYAVLEEIGRGGMGRVLRAYDPKLQREVALKELRRVALSPAMTRRFVSEARAMAKVAHPNVVAVFDVEELEAGRVVLVMEYVPGTTLRTWLDLEERSWTEIVRAYICAGHGLAAAHDAELLHRDFKPTNVLVSHDGTVKVTDFGLAKVTGSLPSGATPHADGFPPSWGESTTLTEAGVVMGTPRYMAPEQHRNLALTTAADQYAFCVSLWEALVGEAPFVGDDGWKRKFKGPPAWPHPSTPRPISEAIRRGLAVDPAARWPDLRSLLRALEYDPAKKRRQWVSGLGLLGLATTMGGLWLDRERVEADRRCTGTRELLADVWGSNRRQALRAAFTATSRPFTAVTLREVEASLDSYAEKWIRAHRSACQATRVTQEQTEAQMGQRMQCLQDRRAALDMAVGVLLEVDEEMLDSALDVAEGLPSLSRCADLQALASARPPPDDPEVARRVAALREQGERAQSLALAGRYDAAAAHAQAMVAAAEVLDYEPIRARAYYIRGAVEDKLGHYSNSRSEFARAYQLALELEDDELQLRAASQLLWVVAGRQQRPDAAQRWYEETLARVRRQRTREELRIDAYEAIAQWHLVRAEYEESRRILERTLAYYERTEGPSSHSVANTLNNLAATAQHQGDLEAAQEFHERALSIRERTLGPEHPSLASSLSSLGGLLGRRGQLARAREMLERAIAIEERSLRPDHPWLAHARGNLSFIMRDQGELDAAAREAGRVLELLESTDDPNLSSIAMARTNLAVLHQDQGRLEEAQADYEAAASAWEQALGPEHPRLAFANDNLGRVSLSRGEYEQARAYFERSKTIAERAHGPDHLEVAFPLVGLAKTALNQGDSSTARRLMTRVLALHEQAPTVEPYDRAEARFLLAQALWPDQGERGRARSLAEEARNTLEELGAGFDEERSRIERWLSGQE